jgi:hypothetical protein
MDAEKMKRIADQVRGKALMITAYSKDPDIEEKLKAMLKEANLGKILVKTCPDYFEWLETLSEEPVSGLGDACRNWINGWVQCGGDCGTENQIKGAINEIKSYGRRPDVPKDPADAMYLSIAEYSKTPFEASVLVMDIMTACLDECQKTRKKVKGELMIPYKAFVASLIMAGIFATSINYLLHFLYYH